MTHNVLVVADPPTGGWQAWCKPCAWLGPVQVWQWAARMDGQTHESGS